MLTSTQLETMRQERGTVACNGCRACCKSDRIRLGPKDDPAQFKHHIEHDGPVLDRKPNGECVYLNDRGCSIYGKAPDICQRFDCRVLFLITPKERRRQRVEQNPTMRDVYAAGRSRLKTLEN